MSTIPEILRARAAADPDARAYVFLDESGAEKAALTYAELHARALAVAARLRAGCAPGDRAMLLFPQCLEFVVAFLGCLYAQVVAVPVNPPRRNRVQDATRAIVTDCAPSAALTTPALVEVLRPALEPLCGSLTWLAVDIATDDVGEPPEPAPPPADALAFLQYTSGSTADPKGVMVTHANLAANEEMIRQVFGHDEHSTVVGWAPFFHDQGLIGNVLQPLIIGATCVLMSPMTFVRRPLLWLSTISRYRVHTSGGPNFAFDACVAHAARGAVPQMDLSCWKVAFNGAEPVRPETLRRFADAFAPSGFSETALHPCYGMAEATLIVTGTGKGRGPRILEVDAAALGERRYRPAGGGPTRTLAGSGRVLPGERLLIVDPATGRACRPDEVGEIWVGGPHVARGYWRRPEATAATFEAELDGDPFLRTGDLGLLVDDELYVVGRLKDVVITRGRNYYPHDVEHTIAQAHPAVRADGCAVFSVPDRDGEVLVAVAEITREHRTQADPAEVTASVRAAVLQEHDVGLSDLVLTLPGRLPKTSSGKIMRSAARRRYLEKDFEVWTPDLVRVGGP